MPEIHISSKTLELLATEMTSKGYTVPGVQKKLSLHLSAEEKARLPLVGYPSGYILKPQTAEYRALPEAEQMVMNDLRAHFRPEFLNRLDETILFKPLTKDNIGGIVDLLAADINRRLADKELTIALSDEAKQFIVDNGYDPVYGARPLKRYLQKNVETLAAKLILSDGVHTGDTILIDVVDGRLTALAER